MDDNRLSIIRNDAEKINDLSALIGTCKADSEVDKRMVTQLVGLKEKASKNVAFNDLSPSLRKNASLIENRYDIELERLYNNERSNDSDDIIEA